MADELVLLEFWSSPYAARVKIALEEKGITNYESHEEAILHNCKSSLLLEMNPVYKKVPVLVHNGKPICESLQIVEYIDEVWKDKAPSLLPADPYDRARARFWANYNDQMFHIVLRKLWRQKGGPQEVDKKEFLNVLKLFEVELADKPYFGGNTFGYLDIALIPYYSYIYSYDKCTKLNIESSCPRLAAWATLCMERDSVKKCLPDQLKIYEYVMELKRMFGNDQEN